MTSTHDSDNDDPLFQFDAFETALAGGLLDDLSMYLDHSTASVRNQDIPCTSHHKHPTDATPEGSDLDDILSAEVVGKGKAVSVPMPIRTITTIDQAHDIFDMSPPHSGSHPRHLHLASPALAGSSRSDSQSGHTPLDDVLQSVMTYADDYVLRTPDSPRFNVPYSNTSPGKGKARELPPTLPPLIFSPTEFSYSQMDWPLLGEVSSTPGPSSYGSTYGSPHNPSSIHTSNQEQLPQATEAPKEVVLNSRAPTIRRIPSRRRSLSSLSIPTTRSLVHSSSRPKLSVSKVPGTLARKLLFRKRHESPLRRNDPGSSSSLLADGFHRTNIMPRRGDIKLHSRRSSDILSRLNVDLVNHDIPSRSYSSPLPQSFLDIIAPECTDIFITHPIVIPNYFALLPRELQLQIFSSLLSLHEIEHDRCTAHGQWTVLRASSSKNQWIGRDRGIRELVRLGRVSKAWQALVFDGQLWLNLDLRAFPKMPASLIVRVTESAGAFIQTIDFRGHTRLQTNTFSELVGNLCLKPALLGSLSCTQLTAVDLQGCSALTTRSLHHLLIRSPLLEKLCLKGLGVVMNTTCDVLAAYCPRLVSLDLSRCSGMDGSGLLSLASAVISRGERLLLKELRVSGLKHVNDTIMATLGKAAPYLEVLDLSYIRQLHNSALEAFVSVEEGTDPSNTVLLTPSEAGRTIGRSNKYRRRVTRIRHLILSSCVLLTDIACSNLAYTMPNLEFLELAGIGAELKDDGLVRLLSTTPLIRRLDLEDATDITDNVLTAITPTPLPPGTTQTEAMQPGHALEHLTISYASNLTEDALLALIHGCTRLKVLEADNTSMSSFVMREFVQVARARGAVDTKIVAIDCRGVTEAVVRDIAGMTRPRLGWRAYEARKLRFLDGRDAEDLKVGQDECDELRVVLKTFYTWQVVDQVKSARQRKRKASSRRAMNDSNGSVSDPEDVLIASGRARWWSPAGARRSGGNSPTTAGLDANFNDSCRIM